MANFGGELGDVVTTSGDAKIFWQQLGGEGTSFVALWWQMQADDHTNTNTCTWLVQGAPDTTATTAAATAAITAAGLNTPVRNIRIVQHWQV